jgi:hypothetical protein
MKRRRLALAALLPLLAAAAYVGVSLFSGSVVSHSALKGKFDGMTLPAATTRELFDVGIADVNGDDRFDIFFANHNTRQALWVSDTQGGYRDQLSALGLDQDPGFPGVEISDSVPEIAEPGVYIYWQGRNPLSKFPLVIRTHRLNELGRLDGNVATYGGIQDHETDVFTVRPPTLGEVGGGQMPQTTMWFSADRDGMLKVVAVSPGAPITVQIGDSVPLANIYVGQQKVRPRAREFDLVLQDRHGMAWSDLNGDGQLDVYISRGAIGGTLRKFPPAVQARIQDELLISQPDGRYLNVTASSGIEKGGCSARKVAWVDFDRDGLLDLFVNCQARGFVEGLYPKQLYRQQSDGKFSDVGESLGLGIPEREVVDFAWVDVDNDGYPDLLTYELRGFFFYRNNGGARFSEEFIGRGKFVRADRPHLSGTSNEYWFVDGKLAVADFDGDGDLDVFSASKMGNTLLLNNGTGGFSIVEPRTLGLPSESVTASWIDFDNDRLLDLFTVPQGLVRQRTDHTFEPSGLLALPDQKYMAAIVNWADLDNDGRRDVVLALLENFSLWNWWEKRQQTSADRFEWKLAAYRNVAGSGQWLAIRLAGEPGNPQAIGARVTVRTAAGQQTQVVGLNDGAFFSQGHYRLYFGLGSDSRVEVMQILWPNGQVQELRQVEVNRLHVIHQSAIGHPASKN